MFGCDCDSCGTAWVDDHHGFTAFTDKSSMIEFVEEDSDWETVTDDVGEDFHFCKDCFRYYDDEDKPIFSQSANMPRNMQIPEFIKI